MGDSTSLMNLGELSKPATVLIEKISDAIGGLYRPYQIRRIAQAEADAEQIKAVSQIEITELQRRAMQRFVAEEAKKQENMESITEKALPRLEDSAQPEGVEDDWISDFFDKCRLVSDEEMQQLWAAVLAGEANAPGKYSKRTLSLLSSLDKKDALLFQNLCAFGWVVGNVTPLVFETGAAIYNERGIDFRSLQHLDDLGLVSVQTLTSYVRQHLPRMMPVFYYGSAVLIEFDKPNDNSLAIGKVMFSKVGQELAPICAPGPVDGFMEYVIERWKKSGCKVTVGLSGE